MMYNRGSPFYYVKERIMWKCGSSINLQVSSKAWVALARLESSFCAQSNISSNHRCELSFKKSKPITCCSTNGKFCVISFMANIYLYYRRYWAITIKFHTHDEKLKAREKGLIKRTLCSIYTLYLNEEAVVYCPVT